MGDEQKVITFNGPEAGQPLDKTPSEQPEDKKAVEPKYITQEEAQRLADTAAENAFRKAQGLVDKADSRITDRVQQGLASLKKTLEMQRATGMEISPEQEEKLRNQIVTNALTETGAESPENIEPGQAQKLGEVSGEDPVTDTAWRMMQKAGITIEENDPEAEELKSIQDPDLFLYGIARAIELKRQRTTSEGTRMPTNYGGTGSHNPNPIEDVNDNDTLWELAEKKHGL